MVRILLLTLSLVAVFLLPNISGQADIVGVWQTIDDKTGDTTSHIEIIENMGNYRGLVVKMLRDDPKTTICNECEDDRKNNLILGLEIIRDMKKYKDYWSYGKILDPEEGKEYKCKLALEGKNTLKVRGYIGAPMFGRTQIWTRVK